MSHHIHGLGTVVVDHHVILEELPEHDSKGEVIGDRHQVGGPVPTALALLRRWGVRTSFQGSWGDDPFGAMIERDLAASGIGVQPPCDRDGVRSGFAHVWVERSSGRRTIAAYRGSHPVGEEDLHHGPLNTCDALHLDGWSTAAAIAAARMVRARGGRVFIDLGSPKPEIEALLAAVDVLNCPARLIERVFGHSDLEKGACGLLEMGPSEVTVTMGQEGALHASAAGLVHAPAFEVRALDTNGAGDVFAGAMVYASLQGWPGPRKLRFACAASALKCRAIGNRESLPGLDDVLAMTAEG